MTKIEWTDKTWPVVTGCSPVSPGCRNCYAARMAATRLKHHPRYKGLAAMPAPGMFGWTGEIRLNHDVLEQPLRWRKPRRVFVASMGDLFHEDVPFAFTSRVFDTMAHNASRHTYQVLTKRPSRMNAFIHAHEAWYASPIPDNIWLGVSIENQDQMWRVEHLRETSAATRFLSLEPLLGPIDDLLPWLRPYYNCGNVAEDGTCANSNNPTPECNLASCPMTDVHRGITWVIVGSESGKGRRPAKLDWIRDIRDQCVAADIPFFLKQMEVDGKLQKMPFLDGKQWNQFPSPLT